MIKLLLFINFVSLDLIFVGLLFKTKLTNNSNVNIEFIIFGGVWRIS